MARREIKVERTTADAVRQALARVPREGAIVRLPAGRIALDRTLEVPSATTIAGAGSRQTILEAAPGLTTAFSASGGHHITIRDLTISWAGTVAGTDDGDGAACSFHGIDHPAVRGVEVLRSPATAVRFDRCTNVQIDRLDIRDAGGSGLLATACQHLDAQHLAIDGAGLRHTASCVHLDGTQEARLHVDARAASGSAVLLDATSGPVAEVVVHGSARGSERGLSAVAAALHPVRRVTVTGTFADNRRDGILLVNVDRAVIVDAVVERNAERGIVLDGRTGSRHCTITGTVVRDCGVALAELGGSRDNVISTLELVASPTRPTSVTAASGTRRVLTRVRRGAVVRARRAERAARRAGRHAPQPVRRSLRRIRNRARRLWRQQGGQR